MGKELSLSYCVVAVTAWISQVLVATFYYVTPAMAALGQLYRGLVLPHCHIHGAVAIFMVMPHFVCGYS